MTSQTAPEVSAGNEGQGQPPLQAGDRLSRAEFERRYAAMPHLKKAELIEGVVYMPSPVTRRHAGPHFDLITWLGTYRVRTPGVEGGDNATVRLDLDNEPQPDAFLRIPAEAGGRSRLEDDYVTGPPELVAEVAATSASYDLHDKLNAFRRNGVQEYVVWRTIDKAVDWFVLREGRYERLAPHADVYKSEVFPGLWLDAGALLAGDMARVLAVLSEGIATPEHQSFLERLRTAG
jgi:Uma2 family endonuclease